MLKGINFALTYKCMYGYIYPRILPAPFSVSELGLDYCMTVTVPVVQP